MSKNSYFLALLAAGVAMSACDGRELAPGVFHTTSPIISGSLDTGHLNVGMLQAGTVGQVGFCTATLIGSRTVLTAAHCIRQGKTHLFHLNGRKYTAQSAVPHERWNPNVSGYPNDIGLLVLASAPTGVTPSPIAKNPPKVGQAITLVGFGETMDGKQDIGQKRSGVNVISDLSATRFGFAGSGNGKASTCEGDSGGPAFTMENGREVQIGITSAGVSPCGRMAWDTRVDAFRAWILKNARGDVADPTDSEPPKVTITSPKNNAAVKKMVTVKTQVTDNVGVTRVDLSLGGKTINSLNKPPFDFAVALGEGKNAITVVGHDAAGNQGSATITVTVGSSSKKAFGAPCQSSNECAGGICAEQGGNRFCTQLCDPPSCPSNGECLPAGAGKSVCVPTGPLNNSVDTSLLVGGCSMPAAPSDGGAGLLLLGLLVAARWRKR